jgi:hypothetical protein
MADTDPISYRGIEKKTPMLTASGTEFGTVEHVLQDSSLDLFDGIAVTTKSGVRFVDARQVGSITVGSVHTTLTDAEAAALPEPEGEPVLSADAESFDNKDLSDWFGRLFMREHWTRKRHEE